MKRVLLVLVICTSIFAQNYWSPATGPNGGHVNCLSLGNDDEIYAGFDGEWLGLNHKAKSLYKINLNGTSWQEINIATNKDIESIVIDSSNNIFIWIGGGGLYKSTNSGTHWAHLLANIDYFYDGYLAVCSNNLIVLGAHEGLFTSSNEGTNWSKYLVTNISYLYVDKSDNIFVVSSGNLLKSADYGVTWSSINNGLAGTVTQLHDINHRTLLAGTEYGIFKSTDGGTNWSYVSGSPEKVTSFTENKNGQIYAGSFGAGIFYSIDKGNTWKSISNNLPTPYITSVLLLPEGSLLAGTNGDGIYLKNINSKDWIPYNNNIISTSIKTIIKLDNVLYAGSKHGILYKSLDEGISWNRLPVNITHLPIVQLFASGKKTLFCSTYNLLTLTEKKNNHYESTSFSTESIDEKGINLFRSTDNGVSWTVVSNMRASAFDTYTDSALNAEYLFAAGFTGVYYSVNDGIDWLKYDELIGIYEDVAVNSKGHIFAASTNSIYCSKDLGKSWKLIYNDPNLVYHITIDVSPNDYLYAGFDWGKIKVTKDNGETWEDVGKNLPVNRINSIETDCQNFVYAGNWWGDIYYSYNFGEDWIDIKSGSVGGMILEIFFDSDENLYIHPETGGIQKNANSIYSPLPPKLSLPDQHAVNQPLRTKFVWRLTESASKYKIQISTDPTFNPSFIVQEAFTNDTTYNSDTLNLNTFYYWRVFALNEYGSSIYSNTRRFRTTSVSSIDELHTNSLTYNLNQNYPNPFNPTTTIKYTVANTQHVQLKVYDVLGNEVAVLVNEEKSPGNYSVEFDANKLSSGVYIYKITAGAFSAAKKLILIK